MSLFLIIVLITLPAFFAACELAILRLRPSRVEKLIEENKKGSLALNRLQRRLRRTLVLVQLGTTLSMIGIGWGSKALSNQISNTQGSFEIFLDFSIFFTIAILTTFLGGLIPKAMVLNRPETAALTLSPLLEAVMATISPLISLSEKVTAILLKTFGLNNQWDSLASALSAGELENLIESGRVTGLHPNEKNILEGVFALRDTRVQEIMVPRSGMVTLPRTVSFKELMLKVHQTKHARFLVTGKSLDEVLGVLDLRLLAENIAKGNMEPDTQLEQFINPVPRVLETATLDEILPLIKSGNPFLLVVDEHGGTEGLITAADLTGEIVGEEIQPESKSPDIKQIDENPKIWLATGNIEIEELNRKLNIDLPEVANHHTLAGFLLEEFQQIPAIGEVLINQGIQFEISSMKGPRIHRVRITLPSRQNKHNSN